MIRRSVLEANVAARPLESSSMYSAYICVVVAELVLVYTLLFGSILSLYIRAVLFVKEFYPTF